MGPVLPVLGIGAVLVALFESAKKKKVVAAVAAGAHPAAPPPPVAPATPSKPNAPPPQAAVPPPAPSGIGVVPLPPPAFPGFVGLANPNQTLSVGQNVNGIWANSELGAQPMAGDGGAGDQAIGAQQAIIAGVVQGGTSDAVTVKVTGVLNSFHLGLPSTITSGKTVTAPTTVWVGT